MPGLTIIVATADPDRFHAALEVAAANAAIGDRTRLFLQGLAVGLLRDPSSPADAKRSEHGVPTVAQLLSEARALGVAVIACQSGLSLCDVNLATLPDIVPTAGLIQLLSSLGDDRLIMA